MKIYDIVVIMRSYVDYMHQKQYRNSVSVTYVEYDEKLDMAVVDRYTSIKKADCYKTNTEWVSDDRYIISEYIMNKEEIENTVQSLIAQALIDTDGNENFDASAEFSYKTDVEGLEGYEYNPLMNLF